MELTGKAKKKFQDWFIENVKYELPNYNHEDWADDHEMLKAFYESITKSMQWGVYLEWADSLGYYISDTWISDGVFCPDITKYESIIWEDSFKSRQEAQQAAITKLNELINAKK